MFVSVVLMVEKVGNLKLKNNDFFVIVDKLVVEQCKVDWVIMKEMFCYFWLKDNMGIKFCVSFVVVLLIGVKVFNV